jgi:adenylate cyclase
MNTQQLTVCVADIDRYNLATRHLTLEQIAEFLQGFYERVGEVLLSHSGRLVKYIGDAALVTFDAGKEEVAVRAMWSLRSTYQEWVDGLSTDLAVSELCVGIATGQVVVGQFGHPRMLQYDVVGRPVTIASFLLNCGGVVMDKATSEAVAGRVKVETATAPGGVAGYRVTGLR